MPRRFAVILAADVVDYSLMMGEDQEATIAMIRDLRERALEPLAEQQGGEVLKRMGDGWIIAFPTVSDAATAAIEIQEGLAEHPKLRLRMGLHMGDIEQDEADVYGTGVNLAARLQTEAPPGGVMISADLHRQLTGKLAGRFSDAGSFKLKNISHPVQGFQWRQEGARPGGRADEVPVISVEGFAAIPNDEETRSAAEDLRDQIVHGLSRRTGIRVLNRQEGETDEATYALRGRLRQSAGRIRINLSLVLKEDGSSRWTEVYEGQDTDLYDFCDEVAGKVDSELRLFINSLDNMRIAEMPDDMLSVSELRTRAAGLFYGCTITSMEGGVSAMERALRLNPDDGMAAAMWAIGMNIVISIRFEEPSDEIKTKLEAATDRAVELLPRSDFVFHTRTYFRASILRDAEKTMADAKRCFALNPNYPQSHYGLGFAYMLKGEFQEAAKSYGLATQLTNDPYWAPRVFNKATAQHCAEDYSGAIDTLRDLIDMRPSVRGYHKLLVLSLQASGDSAAAAREEEKIHGLDPGPNFFCQEPILPDSHRYLRNEIAPQSRVSS